jgi:hypothetical protein
MSKGNADCHIPNDRFREGWDRIFKRPHDSDDAWKKPAWVENLASYRDDDDARELSYEDILKEIGE